MGKGRGLRAAILLVVVLAVLVSAASAPEGEQIQRHRNLGKAFYENPTTHVEAIAECKKSLDLAPDEAIGHYPLGAVHRAAGRNTEAIAQFEEAARLRPLLAAAHLHYPDDAEHSGYRREYNTRLVLRLIGPLRGGT